MTVPSDSAKKGWLQRLREGLSRSTSKLSDGITGIFTKRKLDDDTLEELEDLLISADLGVSVAAGLTAKLAEGRFDKEIEGEEVKRVLAGYVADILRPVARPLAVTDAKPHIILMTGVNGAGKTTTIGKIARQFQQQGKSVMLAAGDTFRAAAIEQLVVWGERAGVPVVARPQGSDPAAVAFEAIERARREAVDILLIDTAGRLQNRDELMDELSKIVRVIGKQMAGAPHDTLLVLDATTGQNALSQAALFGKAAAVSGLIMTKLDGSAKGGVLVAIADAFALPIHMVGVGEGIEDLQAFDPKEFSLALLDAAEATQTLSK